jgi:hypothetical protein
VAVIGDIRRFATSKNLVSYLGLNLSVVQSGEFEGGGALHGHGRGNLRALLIQASKRLLTTVNPLQKWGLSVALRRETTTLLTKLTKLSTELGVATLRELGYASKVAFQQQKLEVLRTHT